MKIAAAVLWFGGYAPFQLARRVRGNRDLRHAFLARYRRDEATCALEQEIAELEQSLARAAKIVDAAMKTGDVTAVLSQFSVSFKDLVMGEALGEGSFGTVVRGTFRGRPVAIKTMRSTNVSKSTVERFRFEALMMAPLNHPHINRMLGVCFEDGPDKLCLVLELCARGALDELLKSNDTGSVHQGGLTWAAPLHRIACEIASAMRYLHHELPGEAVLHRQCVFRCCYNSKVFSPLKSFRLPVG